MLFNTNEFEILVGLRHPSTGPIEANGAFIAAKKYGDQSIKICTFHDGAEIVGTLCSREALDAQLVALEDREWKSMGDSDIYVTSHGMGSPQTPFWER